MKNNLTVFKNEQFGQVRTINKQGEPWFVLSDLCKPLGLSNPTMVAKKLDDDERAKSDLGLKEKNVTIVNESGLYTVILRSDKKEAKAFRKWVTSEVLPSIRKTGKYETDMLKQQRVETARINAESRRRKLDLEEARFLYEASQSKQGEYKQVLEAHAIKRVTGEFLLPLPEVDERTYSAGEIGAMLGVSAQKIGRLSNENGMKTEYYGKWFYDKAKSADKQVETFRYYERAIEVFRKLLAEVA